MNYQRIYDSIISEAKSENRKKYCGIYYENHHIIPKCLGGNNKKENKVLLIAKEHFVCHKLLTYLYKGNRGIAYSFHIMVYGRNGNIKKSSRDYKYARELVRISFSEEAKEKMSKALLGKNKGSKNGMFNKHLSDDQKLNISIFHSGKIISEKTKNLQSLAQMGENNSMFGKPAWDAINKIRKKCEYCEIETTIGNYIRWHGENCKHRI